MTDILEPSDEARSIADKTFRGISGASEREFDSPEWQAIHDRAMREALRAAYAIDARPVVSEEMVERLAKHLSEDKSDNRASAAYYTDDGLCIQKGQVEWRRRERSAREMLTAALTEGGE